MLWIAASLLSQATLSCYDVQYTTAANGDSPYTGTSVTVQAVVTGIRYYTGSNPNNFGFFIGDATGGPFSGLFIYNQSFQPALGYLVRVTGTVTEYYGWTELTSLTASTVISSGNPLPPATLITTGALANPNTAEQWESVLVSIVNSTVQSSPNLYQEFFINDGSGNAQVDNNFFAIGHEWNNIAPGTQIESITGLVDYAFSYYALCPRNMNDIIISGIGIALSIPQLTVPLHSTATVPISVSGLSQAYQNYNFSVSFNPTILSYSGYDLVATLSEGGVLGINQSSGAINLSYSTPGAIVGSGELLKLNFMSLSTGNSPINISQASFGDDPVNTILPGSVSVNASYNVLGDTLTTIQHPILNIPEIVIPGEEMVITCLAPASTTGWQVNLLHKAKDISLPLINSQYVQNPARWLLTVSIPNVQVFELYNLRVRASGGIDDVTRNAVQVLPTRKSSYYFAHITDLHLPTRIYWPNAGFDTDSLSVIDFRAVMDDLNLIRPEFILLTGDLINEGELEGFAQQYWYGWTQNLLSELQIPVYVTSGNHDIGGWNATPPPSGSSRRNWWRYFGWSWLDNPDYSWGRHTQDYYFTYNGIHYIGMESYDNYDNFRSYIYGSSSYTLNQMNWLQSTLQLYPGYKKVLFHHYDFLSQLNLTSLGLDMSLWGHVHSNQGSISNQPYDLATRSVCDGNRAYRIVRVNGNQLLPMNTIYAGNSGQNLSHSFFPSNYGIADSVYAVVINNQNMSFENTLLRFVMPPGSGDFRIYGGVLEQVDYSGTNPVCYVRVALGTGTSTVAVKAGSVNNQDYFDVPAAISIMPPYPNPFSNISTLQLSVPKGQSFGVQVYNLRGQMLREIYTGIGKGSMQSLSFDGKDASGKRLTPGIYVYKIHSGNTVKSIKTVLY